MRAAAEVREATVRVQVRRADGRVEDLGVVSRYERGSGRRPWFVARCWAHIAGVRRVQLARLNVGRWSRFARLWPPKARVGWARPPRLELWRGRSGAGKER